MEKEIIPNKEYDGETCFSCKISIKAGKNQEEIDGAHSNCHGWYHCGPGCCGECPHCGCCGEFPHCGS